MGIKVIWKNENKEKIEIEFFYGIDTKKLENLPDFSQVEAYWPQEENIKMGIYNVSTGRDRDNEKEKEVRLVVEYKEKDNKHLTKKPGHFLHCGKNIIILKKNKQKGTCIWKEAGKEDEKVDWYAFEENDKGRDRKKYFGGKMNRDEAFRERVLAHDYYQCTLSAEETRSALEAAHLISVKDGGNDVPCNGITLRADLHKLFDDNLFSFTSDGKVVVSSNHGELSKKYQKYLDGKSLPEPTLNRVRDTLRRLDPKGRGG